MSQSEVLDYVYKLCDAIKNSEEFKLMIELKNEINDKLGDLLERFDKAKEKYNKALEYGSYHPNLEEYQIELSKIKEELFTNELVSKYKRLEKLIQEKLDKLFNEIKLNMSNKFELTKLLDM
ncbi:MAG: YlbF family regulator [Anaeroplasmataceae bacterium]